METLEAIRKRSSLKRQLSEQDVEPEKINAVIDAARLAPSGRNKQPWRFVVVKGKEAVEALADAALMDSNKIVRDAPVLIVVCAQPDENDPDDRKQRSLFDVGLAVENMVLAATDMGLATHLMGGFDEAKVKEMLHIPDNVRVAIVTPLAYPAGGSYDVASQERLAGRERKGIDEITYAGKWGEIWRG